MSKANVVKIFDNATTTGTSSLARNLDGQRSIQASITGIGVVTGTVEWYGSNIETLTEGCLVATSTLSGTNVFGTGTQAYLNWPYMYAKITAIAGTGAKITATIGN